MRRSQLPGSNLAASAKSRLIQPGMQIARPLAAAASPARTTLGASIHSQPGRRATCSRIPLASWNSVKVKPGHSAVTRTPAGANSAAKDSENLMSQTFAGPYSVCPAVLGMKPASELTLIMVPWPRARMPAPRR